jgi:AmmeMemoRadiSam system protein B
VHEALAHAIRTECVDVVELPAAHGREHSLEMQLPFIAHLLPEVPIVPLVMGQQTRETAFELGNGLAAACRLRDEASGEVLLIASSDLSHYENAAVASAMDAIMVRYIEALDPEGLMNELEREPRHACGGGPMAAVLQAAKRLGAAEARVLRYGDSGDITGDKSSVVGYLAAAVF